MKKCAKCGFAETDDAKFCSSCGNSTFLFEDKVAKTTPYGSHAGSSTSNATQTEYVDMDKRPIGMVVLTFFLPFIGGYFLIKPDVNKGLRTFGIVWCAIMAASLLAADAEYGAVENIIGSALCLAPIVVYLIRKYRFEKDAQQDAEEQRTKELLSMPLETFADKEVEEIAKKYKDSEQNDLSASTER